MKLFLFLKNSFTVSASPLTAMVSCFGGLVGVAQVLRKGNEPVQCVGPHHSASCAQRDGLAQRDPHHSAS